MECCYVGIYRGTIPLVTVSSVPGTWDKLYLNMCEHNQIIDGVQTMQKSDGYYWGVFRDKDSLTFLIVNKGINQVVMESSLESLRSGFHRHQLDWKKSEQHGLKIHYEGTLSAFMQKVTRDLKVKQVQMNVAEISDNMSESYQNVLLRGKNLDQVTQLTDQLGSTTTLYKRESVNVKRSFCWEKYRWTFFLIIILLIFIYIIAILFCGGIDLKPYCFK